MLKSELIEHNSEWFLFIVFFIILYVTENLFQILDLVFYGVYKNLVLINDVVLVLNFRIAWFWDDLLQSPMT